MNTVLRIRVVLLALLTYIRLHAAWACVNLTRRVLRVHIPTDNDWGTISVAGTESLAWADHLTEARDVLRRRIAARRWPALTGDVGFHARFFAENLVGTVLYPALAQPHDEDYLPAGWVDRMFPAPTPEDLERRARRPRRRRVR